MSKNVKGLSVELLQKAASATEMQGYIGENNTNQAFYDHLGFDSKASEAIQSESFDCVLDFSDAKDDAVRTGFVKLRDKDGKILSDEQGRNIEDKTRPWSLLMVKGIKLVKGDVTATISLPAHKVKEVATASSFKMRVSRTPNTSGTQWYTRFEVVEVVKDTTKKEFDPAAIVAALAAN